MAYQKNSIPLDVCWFIISQLKTKVSYAKIVKEVQRNFGKSVSKNGIYKIKKKYDCTGSVVDRPKCGRPRKLSLSQEREMVQACINNRKLTANSIARNPKLNPSGIHARTVTRLLNKNGLKDSTEVPQQIS